MMLIKLTNEIMFNKEKFSIFKNVINILKCINVNIIIKIFNMIIFFKL